MPIYEYRCEKGHEFEVLQSMTDDPVTVCRECGAPVNQVFHPVAIHFKGSGFYSTDYGKGGEKKRAASGSRSESPESKSKSSNDKGSSSESKSDSGASSSTKSSGDSKTKTAD